MKIIKYPKKETWKEILKRPTFDISSLEKTVQDILNDIKINGDKAVRKYSLKFDKADLNEFSVNTDEIREAEKSISDDLKKAISLSCKNIEVFHSSQKQESKVIETSKGVKCWQKSVAIEKVGLYVPGGLAPLFSTVLMLGIPAKIAGCKDIVLCTPPDKNGKIHPAILYAAQLVGITSVFKVGGVQAIAAMAYGTESIPKVYKIFGPGNQYVTSAKQQVSRDGVAIDMPAGPSEVAVMADGSANPSFVASDLLSQAEHGADSQVIMVTADESIVKPVLQQVESQVELLPRKELARKSLENSKIIILKDIDEMVDIINEYAPEHLIISVENYLEIAERIINAGSVFLGNLTPESAGDYSSGTNHTLPTNGYAKMYNGVNLDSYIKKITFQELSTEGLKSIGPSVEIMAATEDLMAHKNAVTLRLNSIK